MSMALNLTREQVTDTIITNLLEAEVLLSPETNRYRKVLEDYNDISLLKVLICSHQWKEVQDD